MTEELAKELALTVSVIMREDKLNGTIMQTFDDGYEIAKKFVEKYPLNTDWEQVREKINLDWDELVVEFYNENKK